MSELNLKEANNSSYVLLKDLNEEDKKVAYNLAYKQYLREECCADLKYMENILIQTGYCINSRTKLLETSYRYRMDLRGKKDNQIVKLDDKNIIVSRSQLLTDKNFFRDIIKHYKKLNTFIKIYQDKRKPGIWWMQFSIN